ncbi:hypothetical protein (nucleomorph) [Guillardia theta]|uniref:Uncharacterized protein n=1 Tax=Guillardia theta TaxID=55529 RepID=Q98S29_GUITH|nr:hypothetical protein GTHECHR3107 [Guillardia theta]AAK39751.1 hypothetical protein [Guillardia theta]
MIKTIKILNDYSLDQFLMDTNMIVILKHYQLKLEEYLLIKEIKQLKLELAKKKFIFVNINNKRIKEYDLMYEFFNCFFYIFINKNKRLKINSIKTNPNGFNSNTLKKNFLNEFIFLNYNILKGKKYI